GLLPGSVVAALTTVQGVVAGAPGFARPRPGVGVTEAELTGAAHEQCHRTTGEEAPFLGGECAAGVSHRQDMKQLSSPPPPPVPVSLPFPCRSSWGPLLSCGAERRAR